MAAIVRRLLLRGQRDEAGAEVVEFALVLPLLLLVLTGIIDFGLMFQRYEVVTNAAREGARVASLPGYAAADVQARVQAYLTASGLTATPTIPAPTETCLVAGAHNVPVVTVTVDYPYTLSIVGPIASLFGGSGFTLTTLRGQSTMRLEGGGGCVPAGP